MTNVDVQLLGEQMKRMQAELRDLRGVRTDVAHLRAEISDRHEGLNERIDNLERAMDARFEQMHQTMGMNLAVVLEAIKAR